MNPKYTEDGWLHSPTGSYLLAQEQAMYDAAVADLFGFNALQVGMPGIDLLRNCRIPRRFSTAREGSVTLLSAADALPLAGHSVDLLALPHVIEFAENPHDTLREAERVLMPEGHLVLSGFNPFSLWGLCRLCGRQGGYPWNGRFVPLSRLKDWLALLGFEVVAGRMGCYAPPWHKESWLSRSHFMDRAGNRWWPMLGGVYFLVAKKRVTGLRLIRPRWNKSSVVRALMPKPTQKAELKRVKHGG